MNIYKIYKSLQYSNITIDVVKILLDIKIVNNNNYKPLHYLFRNININSNIVTYIINQSDLVNYLYKKDKKGYTALHILCMNTNIDIDIIKLFINLDLFYIQSNNLHTPLHLLCMNKHKFISNIITLFTEDIIYKKNRYNFISLDYLYSNNKSCKKRLIFN